MGTYEKKCQNIWKKELKNVCKGFRIEKAIYEPIIEKADKADISNMPTYYNGNVQEYKYDLAYKKLKPLILAR